jgi:hypothetical protein
MYLSCAKPKSNSRWRARSRLVKLSTGVMCASGDWYTGPVVRVYFCKPHIARGDWTAWLGWEDSNFRMRRGSGRFSHCPEMLRQQSPIFPCGNDWTSAANRASVWLVEVALFASSWIPPRWRYRCSFRWCFGNVRRSSAPTKMPPDVNMKMMPDTGKALMTHAAACFGAGRSAFQPSSTSPVEALVSFSGWMRNHAT